MDHRSYIQKGAGLYKGFLYTAETTGVAVIDVEKASIVKRIPVEGAGMLNDLVVDTNGIIYVTDTRAAKVYRIQDDKPEVYLENMQGANGLLLLNKDLYVLTSSAVDKVNETKQVAKIADGFESGLDKIVLVANNEFVISNYKGIMYYLNADGTKQVLSDTREKGISANDISYDTKTKTVYVAAYSKNRIIAFRVK